MLIWGSGGDSKDLGLIETKHCETCEKDRPFKLFLQYRYAHLWYLFAWVSQKKYLSLCDVCSRGVQLDTKQTESTMKSNPIPFQKRYGWTFLVGLIVFLVGFGALVRNQHYADQQAYVSDPQVNDLYVGDLSRLTNSTDRAAAYGVMRIKSINGDNIELWLPKLAYSKAEGAEKDVRTSKVGDDYFSTDTHTLSKSELAAKYDGGAISNILRK